MKDSESWRSISGKKKRPAVLEVVHAERIRQPDEEGAEEVNESSKSSRLSGP
jgi:hypothetical protein